MKGGKVEQNQRFQKLMPVGKLYSNGLVYFLLKDEPENSNHEFVDRFRCWEFMVVPDESLILDDHVAKSGDFYVHPSPRLIVVTDFLIEWGANQPILAMPTEYEEMPNAR